jgi:predicted nucleotide-binding protein
MPTGYTPSAKPAQLLPFIVHGHDAALKAELKDYLQNRLKMDEPVILDQQKNGGRTIVEKFEYHAKRVDVAFVLMSPDDVVVNGGDDVAYQARQNVIFELGYFVRHFGRLSGRVILLHKGPLAIPSDLSGVAYIDVSNGIESAGEKIRKEVEGLARFAERHAAR